MIDLVSALKPFENDSCGGYHEYIMGDKWDEYHIGDVIDGELSKAGIDKKKWTITYAFDNPGISISILSLTYEDKSGNLVLETLELISC